jgi:hypothetical protein
MIKVRRPAADGFDIALAWIVTNRHGRRIFWHDGAVGGFQSFAGYDTKAGIGVIALSNMDVDVSDIGMHMLDPSAPLEKLRPLTLDAEKPDPAFAASPEFSGRLEQVRTASISVRLVDGRVIDAVLPKTSDLATDNISAHYNIADRVRIACKPIKTLYDAEAGIHLHLELASLQLVRPASQEEKDDEAALPPPQLGEAAQQAELERARQVNLQYFSKLPDLVADETARRYSSSTTSQRWRLLDAVDTEITVKDFQPGAGWRLFTRQHIRWNGIPWRRSFEELDGQHWYAFGIELKPLFDPECPTKIDFVKRVEVSGKQVSLYRFSSPAGGCFFTYLWGNARNRYNPTRTGRILVDAALGNVIRYEEEASGYPVQFGLDRDTIVENWDWVKIGGAAHCVPVSADFIRQKSDGAWQRTIVEYTNHRHFEASTTVTFGKDK